MRRLAQRFCSLAIVAGFLECAAGAQLQLFESRSKRSESDTMDIVVREIERRTRSSILEVTIKTVGSSVGASFFLLCSIRRLALERGNYRYVAKIDERPKPGQMLVGFMRHANDDLMAIAPEFYQLADKTPVIDLEQFEPMYGRCRR
jgi:hypothetical protein